MQKLENIFVVCNRPKYTHIILFSLKHTDSLCISVQLTVIELLILMCFTCEGYLSWRKGIFFPFSILRETRMRQSKSGTRSWPALPCTTWLQSLNNWNVKKKGKNCQRERTNILTWLNFNASYLNYFMLHFIKWPALINLRL